MIIVSGCLVGRPCKYNGGNNYNAKLVEFLQDKDFVLVCPETAGGLTSPRAPAEIRAGQVIDSNGVNRTESFKCGAAKVLAKAKKYNADLCILKESSPSCGVHIVYDGTFSGRKIEGQGITTKLLQENNFKVISEKDLQHQIVGEQ